MLVVYARKTKKTTNSLSDLLPAVRRTPPEEVKALHETDSWTGCVGSVSALQRQVEFWIFASVARSLEEAQTRHCLGIWMKPVTEQAKEQAKAVGKVMAKATKELTWQVVVRSGGEISTVHLIA
jgi:hypothetical protein